MFYLGWFACVMGPATGTCGWGPSVVAALALVHLFLAAAPVQDAKLILPIGIFGFGVDRLQASAGVYAFAPTSAAPWLGPPWMKALSIIFAKTLNASMLWLAGRYRLAAVLGALCGPVSYVAGARLGAIEFPAHAGLSLVGIAIVWAGVMPSLSWIRDFSSTSAVRVPLRSPAGAQ